MTQKRLGEGATVCVIPGKRVLQPLTQAVFRDDDFTSEAWQWQMDDEIHPVILLNTDTQPSRAYPEIQTTDLLHYFTTSNES